MVGAAKYQPDLGDLIWIDFSPNAGTEQGGRRPGLVLTPQRFNIATGLALTCPVTSKIKGGSFEVKLPTSAKLQGVVLCDHIRSLDWLARNAEFHAALPKHDLLEVLARIEGILSLSLSR